MLTDVRYIIMSLSAETGEISNDPIFNLFSGYKRAGGLVSSGGLSLILSYSFFRDKPELAKA